MNKNTASSVKITSAKYRKYFSIVLQEEDFACFEFNLKSAIADSAAAARRRA
ncbi:MAG: hypothetical protein H8D96_08095 [Desulfobacterales bacterium]|uniref:Uncharacterized protein n=1 Tax=Candidatus Desulfatibia vada TaxID=2841696 RepID=A0A8J6P093_9BACT|nr:hypothetical protein [Candidatus Desulfatibia vada]MBL6970831.1 hypothetical protein [Desulfobacterales bacterium]